MVALVFGFRLPQTRRSIYHPLRKEAVLIYTHLDIDDMIFGGDHQDTISRR